MRGRLQGARRRWAGPLAPLPCTSPNPRLPEGEQVPAQLSCLWEQFRLWEALSVGWWEPSRGKRPQCSQGPASGRPGEGRPLQPLSGPGRAALWARSCLVSPCCSPAFPSGLISHPLGPPPGHLSSLLLIQPPACRRVASTPPQSHRPASSRKAPVQVFV